MVGKYLVSAMFHKGQPCSKFNMNYSVAVAGGVAPRHGNHEEVTWKTTTVKYLHRVRQDGKTALSDELLSEYPRQQKLCEEEKEEQQEA